jgi:rod shape-determining protein MreD
VRARYFTAGLILALLVHFLLTRWFPDLPRVVDVLLVLVILNGLPGRTLSAMLGGLAAGLAADTLSGGLFGLYGFANTLTGYGTAQVSRRVVTHRLTGVLGVFLLAAAFQRVTLYALDWFLHAGTHLPPMPWALVPVLATTLLGGLTHAAMARWQRSSQERRWKSTGKLQGKG